MAVKDILEYPDPRLRQSSQQVKRFDDNVARVVTDLIDTLHATQSIGLSAPQIDVRQQILVMDHSADQSQPEIFINPTIKRRRRRGLVEERCLSIPNVVAHVLRATEIEIVAYDRAGVAFERELSGMPAVCLQHEIDHFDGKLLADRINWFRRRRLDAAIKKQQRVA